MNNEQIQEMQDTLESSGERTFKELSKPFHERMNANQNILLNQTVLMRGQIKILELLKRPA